MEHGDDGPSCETYINFAEEIRYFFGDFVKYNMFDLNIQLASKTLGCPQTPLKKHPFSEDEGSWNLF